MSTLLAGLGRDATARVRRALRPLGLGAQQFLVLEQLQALGETASQSSPTRSGSTAATLRRSPPTSADRGLAQRTRHATDRRRYVLSVTRRRLAAARPHRGAIAAAEDDLLSPLDAVQREQLYALLRRLADGVELCPTGDEPAD